MSFLSLIIKNPFRNKSRALLAIIGIGIGIATIIALGAITEGMISSADDTLRAGGSDFTVSGKVEGESSQMVGFGTSSFDDDYVDKLANVSGVDRAVPIYMTLLMTKNSPYFAVIGMNPSDYKIAELTITDGRMYKDGTDEIVLGKIAADNEEKEVGDTILLDDKEFDIVGIYESGNSYQDQGGFTSLDNSQKLSDDEGKVSTIYIKVDKGADVEAVEKRIDDKYGDNLTTISSLSDLDMVKNMIDMLNGASLAISILAVVIGAVGIINTMLTSVYERTRELGVLKAVGWSDGKILLMIIGESIVITIVAGIIGSIAGIIGVELIVLSNIMPLLTPIYTVNIFVQAFSIALFVGIIGGIYPALKAVKLPPTEALRYE